MTSDHTTTDEELMDAHREGDTHAFDVIVRRHLRLVYNFSYRFVGSNSADDVTQEVFLKAFTRSGSFRKGMRLKPWLLQIARNSAIDHLRKVRAIPFSALDNDSGETFAEGVADDAPMPDEIAMRADDAQFIAALLDTLSLPAREIVMLHVMGELSFDEIATLRGEPLNTVKSRYRRALHSLQETARKDRLIGNAPKEGAKT